MSRPPADHLARRRRPVWLVPLLAAAALLAAPAAASAGPVLQIDKRAPAKQLYGTQAEVSVTASVPLGDPDGPGYNLTLRDVLPAGVRYIPGSTDGAGAPRVIADAPAPGQTTLIWENIADVWPGSQVTMSYRVGHRTVDDAPPHLVPGDSYTNSITGYVNDEDHVRDIPKFTAAGAPVAGTYTGSAGDSATTLITAIAIDKSEPSPEGELLRGAHDHQTVYTLTVRNNAVRPTSAITVDDYLPAGLEFLQCGTGDNSAAEEYPGAGLLNPGHAPPITDCHTPQAVETVALDPDGIGPLPFGVYTHVTWEVPDLDPGDSHPLRYVAAIPIRANTLDWPGLAPTPDSLEQGSNLDNNTGSETGDEQALTNLSRVTGTYDGGPEVSDSDSETVTAEDIRLLKSVSPGTIAHGGVSTWTLQIDTGEYRSAEEIAIDDRAPDGTCPLDATANHEHTPPPASSECDPIAAGDLPAGFAAYTTATEQADGSWQLTWDSSTVAGLGALGRSDTLVVRYPTRTRSHYQENYADADPVLGRDRWRNDASLATTTRVIDAGGAPIDHDGPLTATDVDASWAEQSAGSGSLRKQVAVRQNAADCATATYVDGPVTDYRPGDRICWKLRVDFPAGLDTGNAVVTDFVPATTVFDAGSVQATAANTVTNANLTVGTGNSGTVLTWEIDDDGGFTGQNRVFEVTFSSRLVNLDTVQAGDILGNLMKLSFVNTDGAVYGLRDEVNYSYERPEVVLAKGVMRVDGLPAGGNAANSDHKPVQGGSVVQWRIDLTNATAIPAVQTEVWDPLPAGFTCADISDISDGGECDAGNGRVVWDAADAITVPASGSRTLTYRLQLPATLEPGFTLTNSAGVRSYKNEDNTGGTFTHFPEGNIDPAITDGTAPAAKDSSDVYSRPVGFVKTIVSSEISDGSYNNGTNHATIGEQVNFRVRLTIPEGTTVHGSPYVEDIVSARWIYTAGSASATFDGDGAGGGPAGPLPGGVSLSDSASTIRLQFPASYTNTAGSGDDIFDITFSARVADVTANYRNAAVGRNVPNTGTFSWQEADATPHTETSTANAQVSEPLMSLAKASNDAGDIVVPGQTVRYTLTASNSSTSFVTTAHEPVIVDTVPPGLTPLGSGGTPVSANGDTVVNPLGTPNGVWNETARTITWNLPDIARNSNRKVAYDVTVPLTNNAGSTFTNSATVKVTSLPGSSPYERTADSTRNAGYVSTATNTVSIVQATTAKSVTPTSATPGQPVTYTLAVTLHGGVRHYDTTVLDRLPDGVDFDQLVSVTCATGCSPNVDGSLIEAHANSDGSTTLGFYLGDSGLSADDRTVTIVYAAHVDDEYEPEGTAVSAGDLLTNSARTYYNGSTLLPQPPAVNPAPGDFSDSSGQATATVTVIAPKIALDKLVSDDDDEDDARPTGPGDTYTFTLKVTNSGTSTAYDVAVADQPDALLTNVVPVAGAAYITDGWTSGDPDIKWSIPQIAAGATVTLTYTAKLAHSSLLQHNDTVVNTASVPLYYNRNAADRGENDDWRSYTDTPPDTVTLTVHLPQLQVQKYHGSGCTSGSGNAFLNQPLTWCLVVTNTDTASGLKNVDLTDTLPPNWQYIASSTSSTPAGVAEPVVSGTPAAGQTLTWSDAFDLAPGATVTVRLQAKPLTNAQTTPGSGPSHPHTNTVVATGEDASGATGSGDGPYGGSDTATAILRIPSLTISKLPDAGTATAGEATQWTVEISNTGDDSGRNLVITDVLPAGVVYTPGSAYAAFSPGGSGTGFSERSVTPNSPSAGKTSVIWDLGTLAAGGKITITVPVIVAASVPDNTTLTNVATVTSDESPDPLGDDGAVTTDTEADLAIVKSDGAVTATAGGTFDYTLTSTNNGPSDAQNVAVQDTIPTELTPRAPLPAGCTYTAITRLLRCVRTTLAAGAGWTLTLAVDVDPSTPDGTTVTNTATVASDTPDPDQGNDSSTETTPVTTSADVRLTKTAAPATILEGRQTTYTLTVTNDGPSDALAVTLADDVPAGLDVQSVGTPSGAVCSEPNPNEIACTFGTIESGGSRVVTVVATGLAVGTHVNAAEVTSTTPDPTPGNNTDEAPVEVDPAADLALVKSGPATIEAGGKLTYTLTVTNHGPSPAVDAFIEDTLPSGTVYDDAASGSSCDVAAGGKVLCRLGTLAPGESSTVEITVTVPAALGDRAIVNRAHSGSQTGDPDPSDNDDDHPVQVGPAVDLSIVKSQSTAVAGSPVVYTLAVKNDGPSGEPAAVVTDSLPLPLEFRAATPSQGTCSAAGQDVRCELGALAAGGSAQIEIVAVVPFGTAGTTLSNTAVAGGTLPDSNPGNNSSTVTQPITDTAAGRSDVAMVKTAGTSTPRLGVKFTYTLAVTNRGPNTATNVAITDTMSSSVRVDDVRGPGCSRSGSTVRCTIPALAVGETTVIEVDVTPLTAGPLRNTASAVPDQPNPNAGTEDDASVDSVGVNVSAPRGKLALKKRAVTERAVAGKTVRWRLTVGASQRPLAGVEVCDRLPAGLTLVAARGAKVRRGRICWTIGFMRAGQKRTLTLTTRSGRGTGGKLRNAATATARNAKARRATATVSVLGQQVRAGGVTG